jgi:hypothetical protein
MALKEVSEIFRDVRGKHTCRTKMRRIGRKMGERVIEIRQRSGNMKVAGCFVGV